MDQRKVNMLAREYCDATKKKFKPVILSHRMMPGLLEVGVGVGWGWGWGWGGVGVGVVGSWGQVLGEELVEC